MTGLDVRLEALEMVYEVDGEQVHALRGIDLEIAAGESIALLGPSGSGKSSLLALLAGLQKPTSGRAVLGEYDVSAMSERELLVLRSRDIGIVVQGPARNLLPYANAEDNIRFAQRAVPRNRRRALRSPAELLESLGLGHVRRSRLGALSGGEQQRLSLAVGLAGAPALLLADEPTSQLDAVNRAHVVDLLTGAASEGTTIVLVTHDEHLAQQVDRSIHLRDGQVVP
jgi:ABC-type lipoprotein export system ATPase subunit